MTLIGFHPRFLVGPVLLIFLIFYVVLLCLYVLSSVLSCPLRFCIKTMFGLYLQLFVVRLMSYLHYLCLLIVVSSTYCVVFLFFFTSSSVLCPTFNVSLDCPFLIAPSVFSNIYLDVPIFSVYPHKCMGFTIDQGEVYSIQFYVIMFVECSVRHK